MVEGNTPPCTTSVEASCISARHPAPALWNTRHACDALLPSKHTNQCVSVWGLPMWAGLAMWSYKAIYLSTMYVWALDFPGVKMYFLH
jgi:hypothetical protein